MSDQVVGDEDLLNAPTRLADLEVSGLLDDTTLEALDALTLAAQTALGPDVVAAITAITADTQVVVSISAGRDAPEAGHRMPLSHSICKRVVMSGEPYVLDDATAVPAHAPSVRDFGVGAYLGSPVHGPRGTVVGAMCVVTPDPRRWTEQELSVLGSLAAAAETVVAMHAAARSERIARSSGAVPASSSARVQHDLRTPLTILLGCLELLLEDEGAFRDEHLDLLRRSHASAERLHDAVDYLRHPAAPPQRR
jgi:GAF domain-containing protein